MASLLAFSCIFTTVVLLWIGQNRQMDASRHKKKTNFFNIALDPTILFSDYGLDDEGKQLRREAIKFHRYAILMVFVSMPFLYWALSYQQ